MIPGVQTITDQMHDPPLVQTLW